MATPKRKVEKALKFILERRRIQSHYRANGINDSEDGRSTLSMQLTTNCKNAQPRFVDLGSGDGTTIFAAASLRWKSTGVELNPTLWALSSLRRIMQPPEIRRNCTFIYGDMFQSARLKRELRNATCVMIFGVNSLMPKIADLIQMECRLGIFVMSYRFQAPLLAKKGTGGNDKFYRNEEQNESRVSGVLVASLIYEEEEMRVYELYPDQSLGKRSFKA